MPRTDRAALVVPAPPQVVYAALTSPSALAAWLPPTGMRGRIETWDLAVGYRMVLEYDDPAVAGKTGDGSDVVDVRFVSLEPGSRVVTAADFVSEDPALAGTMTMTWSLEPDEGGTLVSVTAEDVPDGISAADHAAGMSASLAQLAAYVRGPIAVTPEPPYTAVIFTSLLRSDRGYAPMAARMEQLAAQQPGYLGIESARTEVGITVSYWTTPQAAAAWKGVAEHVIAQERGRAEWYASYRVRVATVEREYGAP